MLRPAIQPLAAPRELFASRIRLPDDAATTLHVARFDRATVRARVVRLPPRLPLRSWCTAAGVDDANGSLRQPVGRATLVRPHRRRPDRAGISGRARGDARR